ncbi:2'-5' RNA ligase family protein [Cellulomonas sp. P5_C5]
MPSLDDPTPTVPPRWTAVLVPVPEAEPAVARHRATLDAATGWGIPAHVTVLFPFAPPDQLDADLLGALASAVASIPTFGCVFRRTGWFGDDILWLDPEPADAFRALTAAVVRAFPQWLPYRGEFSDVVPHLTVGERRLGDLDTLRAAEADVVPALPVAATVREALLVAGSDAPSSWRTVARLPLGAEPDMAAATAL